MIRVRISTLALAVLLTPAAIPQWVPQSSGTTASLRGISAASDSVVWASGTQGTFLKTLDGGVTWQAGTVDGAGKLDFRGVHAIDARNAYLMSAGLGHQSRIYRTSDGGAHWQLQHENAQGKGFFDAIAFWDKRRGIVLGDPVDGNFVILTTTDAGATWLPAGSGAALRARPGEGAFAASGTCLIVGRGGRAWFATGGPTGARVFRSTDWGRTWAAAETPIRHDSASSGIFSLAFRGNNDGIAVGGDYTKPTEDRDNIAVTHDGGKTWTAPPGTRPAGYRSAVAFIPSSSRAIATGPSGSDISTSLGESWKPLASEGYNALSFSSSRSGWAVGPQGKIARIRLVLPHTSAVTNPARLNLPRQFEKTLQQLRTLQSERRQLQENKPLPTTGFVFSKTDVRQVSRTNHPPLAPADAPATP